MPQSHVIVLSRLDWLRYMKKYFTTTPIPWRTLTILSLISFVLWVIDKTRPFGPRVALDIYGISAVIGALLTSMLCLRDSPPLLGAAHSRQIGQPSGRRFCPALLSMGMFSFACGQCMWVISLFLTGHIPPFPSLPHLLWYGMYPFFISAILLLPSSNLSPLSRLRTLLDSLMSIIALATLCSYFILVPILVEGHGTTLAKIAVVIYPSADLVVMFCLLLVVLRSHEVILRPVLIMLELATLLIFISHIIHVDELLSSSYKQVSAGGWFWPPALILIIGAAQTISHTLRMEASTGKPTSPQVEPIFATLPVSRCKAMLSPVLVLIFGVFIFMIWLSSDGQRFAGQFIVIYVGGFVVLILMVLRQFLALYEVESLQEKLQARTRSLHMSNTQLERLATSDPLTSLPNHRTLVERLDKTLGYARIEHTPYSVIFMDVDHFKSINDQYGHPVGDAVLCQLGKLMQRSVPTDDCVGRWGGEEFVAILPGSDATAAFLVAEQLRVRISEETFACNEHNAGIHVTCSLGVASYPSDATECANLIRDADIAMYAAKRLGRNQTRVASEPFVQTIRMSENLPQRWAY